MKVNTKFNIQITEIEKLNPLFSKCLIKILHIGKNNNRTEFTKEVVENAIPTLYNIPIIGEYIQHKEDFKDHGGKIVITDESVEYIHTTVPYGLVPADAEVFWQTITEDNGEEKEYLCCTGYLWTGRYPDANRVIEKGNGQSMELDPDTLEGNWTNYNGVEYFKFDKFVF